MFVDIEPLALSVVDGFNVSIIAYGQTGSGKTYTMNGVESEPGISYRTMNKIFQLLEYKKMQEKYGPPTFQTSPLSASDFAAETTVPEVDISAETERPEFSYTIQVSMLEIYNEQVKYVHDYILFYNGRNQFNDFIKQVNDLLISQSSAPSGGLDVRLSPEGEVFVQGLSKHKVESVEEVFKIFDKGSLNRATAATNLNEHSSRSHSILLVEVTTHCQERTHVGKLYLIDLAGSERVAKSGVTGVAMKEAQNINRSLSALGDVMEALDSKSKHVPFRNSVLTFLLQNSLGGSARTMMLVTVCPTDLTSEESLFTLQFASRVRNITLGSAKRNSNASVKNLEDQFLTLKSELKECKRKKMVVEEALLELKREKKRDGDKVNNQIETKVRQYEEARKTSDAIIAQLQKVNNENMLKLLKEREAKSTSAGEVEKLQKSVRKLQNQLAIITEERDELTLTVKILKKSSLNPHQKIATYMTTAAGGKLPATSIVEEETKSQDDLSVDPKLCAEENEESQNAPNSSGDQRKLYTNIVNL